MDNMDDRCAACGRYANTDYLFRIRVFSPAARTLLLKRRTDLYDEFFHLDCFDGEFDQLKAMFKAAHTDD